MAKPIRRSASKEYAEQLARLKAIKRSGKGVTTTKPAGVTFKGRQAKPAAAEIDQAPAAAVSEQPPFKKASSSKAD